MGQEHLQFGIKTGHLLQWRADSRESIASLLKHTETRPRLPRTGSLKGFMQVKSRLYLCTILPDKSISFCPFKPDIDFFWRHYIFSSVIRSYQICTVSCAACLAMG